MGKTNDRWPRGWQAVNGERRLELTTALLVQMGRGAALADKVEAVVAARDDDGAVVVAMRRWEAPFAVVHLVEAGADRRHWLLRHLRPRPALVVTFDPLARVADLGAWRG
jgi:hypothetical protein